MTVVDADLEYGLTYNTQTGEAMKLHRSDCTWYLRSHDRKPVTPDEVASWMGKNPLAVCSQCVTRGPNETTTSEPVTDVLDHILSPARLLDDVLTGKKGVKALCGKVITQRGRSNAPICRKCFNKKFPKVK